MSTPSLDARRFYHAVYRWNLLSRRASRCRALSSDSLARTAVRSALGNVKHVKAVRHNSNVRTAGWKADRTARMQHDKTKPVETTPGTQKRIGLSTTTNAPSLGPTTTSSVQLAADTPFEELRVWQEVVRYMSSTEMTLETAVLNSDLERIQRKYGPSLEQSCEGSRVSIKLGPSNINYKVRMTPVTISGPLEEVKRVRSRLRHSTQTVMRAPLSYDERPSESLGPCSVTVREVDGPHHKKVEFVVLREHWARLQRSKDLRTKSGSVLISFGETVRYVGHAGVEHPLDLYHVYISGPDKVIRNMIRETQRGSGQTGLRSFESDGAATNMASLGAPTGTTVAETSPTLSDNDYDNLDNTPEQRLVDLLSGNDDAEIAADETTSQEAAGLAPRILNSHFRPGSGDRSPTFEKDSSKTASKRNAAIVVENQSKAQGTAFGIRRVIAGRRRRAASEFQEKLIRPQAQAKSQDKARKQNNPKSTSSFPLIEDPYNRKYFLHLAVPDVATLRAEMMFRINGRNKSGGWDGVDVSLHRYRIDILGNRADKIIAARDLLNTYTRKEGRDCKRPTLELPVIKTNLFEHKEASALSTQDAAKLALRTLSHPVVLVTSRAPKETDSDKDLQTCRGVTVSSFTSVTLDPFPVVSFNIRTPSSSWDAISSSGKLCIHLLEASPEGAALAGLFTQKYDHPGTPFRRLESIGAYVGMLAESKTAPPQIKFGNHVSTYIEAVLMSSKCVGVGDHMIVVARVTGVHLPDVLQGEQTKIGLAYAAGGYRAIGDQIEPVSVQEIDALGFLKGGLGPFDSRLRRHTYKGPYSKE